MSEIWIPGKGIIKIEEITKYFEKKKEQKKKPEVIEPVLTKVAELVYNEGSLLSEGYLKALLKSVKKDMNLRNKLTIDMLISNSIVKQIIMPSGNFYALTEQGKSRLNNLTNPPPKKVDEIKILDAMHKALSILKAKHSH